MSSGGLANNPYAVRAEDRAYCLGFYGPCNDIKGRTRVTGVVQDANTAVLLSFGQSKSDNVVQSDSYATVNLTNYNFSIWDGLIYRSAGSLLGNATQVPAAQAGVSYMTRLADKIITAGSKTKVILVPMAVNGVQSFNWAAGGMLEKRYTLVARRLADAGLTVTHILWDQGETDAINSVTAAAYTANMQSIRTLLNQAGITAPLYVALTTWQGTSTNTAVRTGQSNAVNGTTILAGPDLDTIPNTSRDATAIHFNATGSDTAAGLWKTALGL